MPDVFNALANPTRREILTHLRGGAQSVTALAEHFEIKRPAVSEHLQVLLAVGLVRDERVGQHRYYHLEAQPLADAVSWLDGFEGYWKGRLRSLRAVLDEENA
jgi:DNA-binding transcriptional ArsR family regulator